MDPGLEAAYAAHYGDLDPRRLRVAGLSEGEWLACHQHFDERAVSRSEFYQDYLIPGDCRWLLGTRLTRRQGLDVYFGIHRAPGQQPFGEDDMTMVRRLTPHFQQAAQLWLATQSLRQQAALGEQGLDALEHGVIATNRHGHLMHANRQAEAMLRTGWPLRLRAGRLRLSATPASAQPTLATTLQTCIRTGRPQGMRLGEWGDPERPMCTLTLLSLAQDSLLRALPTSAEVMLLLSHTRHRRQATVAQLMALFGLTPAEARLARDLASGHTLDSSAQSHGLSINTARTQLQAIFRKVGTRSQAELLRLLGMLPSGRAG
jgi:DNA-binding CsgD family transcriptional regulator